MEGLFLLSVVAVLIMQIVVTVRCKKKSFKFLPLIISSTLVLILLIVGMLCSNVWTGAGLWIAGVLSLLYPVACVLGWGLAWLLRRLVHL